MRAKVKKPRFEKPKPPPDPVFTMAECLINERVGHECCIAKWRKECPATDAPGEWSVNVRKDKE